LSKTIAYQSIKSSFIDKNAEGLTRARIKTRETELKITNGYPDKTK